jgi:hypothetical protein
VSIFGFLTKTISEKKDFFSSQRNQSLPNATIQLSLSLLSPSLSSPDTQRHTHTTHHKSTKAQKHQNTKTQKHKNTKHKNTKTQKHKNSNTFEKPKRNTVQTPPLPPLLPPHIHTNKNTRPQIIYFKNKKTMTKLPPFHSRLPLQRKHGSFEWGQY